MKKQILILLSFGALALYSCGGGSQPKQGVAAQAADTVQSADNTAEIGNEIVSVPEAFLKFVNGLPKSPDKEVYSLLIQKDFQEGLVFNNELYRAYPMKNGGYLTICISSMMNNNYECDNKYLTYAYKDGDLKPVENVLPLPDANMLIDNKKKAGHEAEVKSIVAIINKHIAEVVYYVIPDDKNIIRVGAKRMVADPDWQDEYYPLLSYDNNLSTYKWDGEKFAPCDMLEEFVKTLPAKPDKPCYIFRDEYDIESEFCGIVDSYYGLPMKDGGYMIVFDHNSQCESTMFWNDCTYTYKNGKLTKVDNILPKPNAVDLLDAAKCKGNDAAVKNIIKQYNSSPISYLLYMVEEDGNLQVSMTGNGCEQWGEADLDYMKNAVYKWDGEKFVLISNNAGSQSDDGDIINAVVKDLATFYDPYGILDGEEEPSAEMVADNLKKIRIVSPTMAQFVAGGTAETFTETFVCYKQNSGTWLMVRFLQSNNSRDCNIKAYDFIDGELRFHDNYFPSDILESGYFSEITANGFTVSTDDADINYKWNGDKFVK